MITITIPEWLSLTLSSMWAIIALGKLIIEIYKYRYEKELKTLTEKGTK